MDRQMSIHRTGLWWYPAKNWKFQYKCNISHQDQYIFIASATHAYKDKRLEYLNPFKTMTLHTSVLQLFTTYCVVRSPFCWIPVTINNPLWQTYCSEAGIQYWISIHEFWYYFQPQRFEAFTILVDPDLSNLQFCFVFSQTIQQSLQYTVQIIKKQDVLWNRGHPGSQSETVSYTEQYS